MKLEEMIDTWSNTQAIPRGPVVTVKDILVTIAERLTALEGGGGGDAPKHDHGLDSCHNCDAQPPAVPPLIFAQWVKTYGRNWAGNWTDADVENAFNAGREAGNHVGRDAFRAQALGELLAVQAAKTEGLVERGAVSECIRRVEKLK